MILKDERKSVAFIIVNFNTSSNIIKVCNNILEKNINFRGSISFIIIDNSSSPAQKDIITKNLSNIYNVELYFLKENVGYAIGNNYGLKRAHNLGIEYCFVINSDIEFVTNEFIEKFIYIYENTESCALIGPLIKLPNGKNQLIDQKPKLFDFLIYFKKLNRYSELQQVYSTVGCCIFGSTAFFTEVDYFDEYTFLYCEEYIMAEKVLNSGKKWFLTNNIIIIHDHKRKISTLSNIIFHKKHEFRSTFYYLRKYCKYGNIKLLLFSIIFYMKYYIYIAIFGSLLFFKIILRRNS